MNYLSILTRTFDVLLDVSALYLGTFFLLLFFHYLSKERLRRIQCPNLFLRLFKCF